MISCEPHEKKYVHSPENIKVTNDLIDALYNKDYDKFDELRSKVIFPLSLLKAYGKDFVIRNGLPIITAEIVNDTDWLK
jgi:hypothetical protein